MNFQEYLAEYVLLSRTANLNTAAEQALTEGLDSPALRMLAGMDNSGFDETELMLLRALDELGINLPDQTSAFHIIICYYLNLLLSGHIDSFEITKIFTVEILPNTKYYDSEFNKTLGDPMTNTLNTLRGAYYEYVDVDLFEGSRAEHIKRVDKIVLEAAQQYIETECKV